MNSSASDSSRGVSRPHAIQARFAIVFILSWILIGPSATAQDTRIGGFLRLDRRIAIADSVRLMDFYNVFRPELSSTISGRADIVVSMDVRFYDFGDIRTNEDRSSMDRHFPNSITLWEAFARISGFIVEPLDLTIGKQRIQWGTADGFNPTDRLNMYDMSDITDFTSRVPTWAIRGEYFLNRDLKLDLVWSPVAHGPILPPGPPVDLLDLSEMDFKIQNSRNHTSRPSKGLADSQYGFRLSGSISDFDVSVSFFDGYDGIPESDRISVRMSNLGEGAVDVHTRSILPRFRVLGADMATDIAGIGIWGETAVVFPDEIERITDIETATGNDSFGEIVLKDVPYITWILGGDYVLPGGFYLNLQWAHGIFLERGSNRLHDYILTNVERSFFREAVSLSIGGILESAGRSVYSNRPGLALAVDLSYTPYDSVELSLGAFLVGGDSETLFGRWSDVDQMYLRLTTSF